MSRFRGFVLLRRVRRSSGRGTILSLLNLLEFSMPKLQDVHSRLLKKKKEKREMVRSFQDELRNNAHYMEILEKIETLKAEKKSIENEARGRDADTGKIEELKVDIQSDTILLADIALNMYVQQMPVEIVDDMNVKWAPVFKVSFKKD